jgi:hypothetical protein
MTNTCTPEHLPAVVKIFLAILILPFLSLQGNGSLGLSLRQEACTGFAGAQMDLLAAYPQTFALTWALSL